MISKGKILLYGNQQFYYNDNLIKQPGYMEAFGEGKITHSLTKMIKKRLSQSCAVLCSGSRSEAASIRLKPFKDWQMKPNVDRKSVYQSYLSLLMSAPVQEGALIKVSEKKREPAPDACQDLLKHINNNIHPAFRYKWIFSQTINGANRLYSRLTSGITRKVREDIMDLKNFKETDITACAWQALHLYDSGEFFHHEVYGSDYYTFMSSLAFPDEQDPKKYRPIIKQLLTSAIGDSRNTINGIWQRIVNYLGSIGVQMTGVESFMEPNDSGQVRRIFLSNSASRSRWLKYVEEQTGKFTEEDQPTIDIERMLGGWVMYSLIYRKYAYKKNYKLGQQIETLANMLLYDYAHSRRIEVLTVHDAAYCPAENVDEIQRKQLEYLRIAAEVYRRFDRVISQRKKEKSTSKTKKKFMQGIEWVLEGLPDPIARAYKVIFNSQLSKTRFSSPRKQKVKADQAKPDDSTVQ